jgi:hypothetical protein
MKILSNATIHKEFIDDEARQQLYFHYISLTYTTGWTLVILTPRKWTYGLHKNKSELNLHVHCVQNSRNKEC